MSLATLRQAVLDQFAASLASHGFTRQAQTYQGPPGPARWLVHVGLTNHGAEVDFTVDVAVRHAVLQERMVNTYRGLSPKQRRQTATVGVELGNWADGRRQVWTVRTPADIVPAVHGAVSVLHQFGWPFMQRFSTIDAILKVLEEDGREARLICPVLGARTELRAVAKAAMADGAT
jgi:hypothetical protein